ncbi:MAG: PilC/PilY family type IV pilus protein, partial [Aquisalimonadaceae bacterium]
AMRKVLYGGKRHIDTPTRTVLERSHVPQDAHTWGKEYTSPAHNGYDLRDYTPLPLPNYNRQHLFASTTVGDTSNPPLFRLLQNSPYRIWEWVTRESEAAGLGGDAVWIERANVPVSPQSFNVRVEVCTRELPEANCHAYGEDHLKPVGLLQDYGEKGRMLFGLLTGSYEKNTSGGVLRKPVRDLTDEINLDTGQFTGTDGIISTIDRLSVVDYNPDLYTYGAGWPDAWIVNRAMEEGEFPDWGNPIAEMMYEGLRYFAGAGAPSPEFAIGDDSIDRQLLGLPIADWDDPYAERPYCAQGAQTVLSDIKPSYDTTFVPGTAFGNFNGDGTLPGLDASALGQKLWNAEYGGARDIFIGEAGNQFDGTPSAKRVDSFGNIRGLTPEEPTKMGGYYSGSVAHYGRTTDLRPELTGKQTISTYAVAMASPFPHFDIQVGGNTVTMIPFGKTISGVCPYIDNPAPVEGEFQPTSTIVSHQVEEITPTSGKLRISFEDVEQGGDHDMDAYVLYSYQVNSNNTLSIRLDSQYESDSCLTMHLGYIISGTTEDGVYLEVRNRSTAEDDDVAYFLDTGQTSSADPAWRSRYNGGEIQGLPLVAERSFRPSGRPAAGLLRDPLWYAAKYGGFTAENGETMPLADGSNWDRDSTGTPDNYFLVTNALGLREQLTHAFEAILGQASSSSAAAVSPHFLEDGNMLYRARYRQDDWSGELKAYEVDDQGSVGDEIWDAERRLPAPNSRRIYTYRPDANPAGGRPFRWEDLSAAQRQSLQISPPTGTTNLNTLGEQRLDWLRGDSRRERRYGGPFRNRERLLGDIVNSDPLLINITNRGHSRLPGTEGATYQQSQVDWARMGRTPMLAVGANNGMVHLFDANTGDEILAYVPNAVVPELWRLSTPDYYHRYYADGKLTVGDAYIMHGGEHRWRSILLGGTGAGGRAVYALDVTNPRIEMSANDLVRWEFTHDELGYTIGESSIIRLRDGRWVAVFGNGYGSLNNRAQLFVVDIATGELIRRIDTGEGSGNAPNGLATPAVVDSTNDRSPDIAYAGDMLGNLWEFDLHSTNPALWSARKVFEAADADGKAQPITSYPEVGLHPRGGLMVLFGTGSFFRQQDQDDRSVQSFYAVRVRPADREGRPVTRQDLQQQRIIQEVSAEGAAFRLTSAEDVAAEHAGWYLDLVSPAGDEGERAVNRPLLDSGRIIFTTLIPAEDVCIPGGTGWLMVMDAFSGRRLGYPVFDVNDDNLFNAGDLFASPEGTDSPDITATGTRRDGHLSAPVLVRGETIDAIYPGGEDDDPTRVRGAFERGRQSWRETQP